jgi:hypothetical protein
MAQIGKISRELEKAQPNKGHGILTNEKTKEQQLADAGITVPTAHRYEQLAAPDAQLAPAVETAMENYFDELGPILGPNKPERIGVSVG